MKPSLIAIAGSLLVCSLAHAQPEPDPQPQPPPDDPAVEEPPPPPARRMMPPPPPAEPVAAEAPAHPTRPNGFSVGLGLGYRVPTDLDLPNITSARFRLASGLTFEPAIVLTSDSSTSDDGLSESTDTLTDVELGVTVRFPLMHRDKVDLLVLGTAAVGVVTSDPEGPANAQTLSAFGLGYGVALDYWINHHWSVSLDAKNPILVYSASSRDNGAGLPETSSSRTTFGAVFDPTLSVMLHLFL